MAAAGEFNTGDVVRKTGLRDFFPSPYVGRVLYSNSRTGKVQVQWPWGAMQESPVELIRDASEDFTPPLAMDQHYWSYEGCYHEDGKDTQKADDKWRKKLSDKVASRYLHHNKLAQIIEKYEADTLPVYRAACKAWHFGLDEVTALRKISAELANEFGTDAIRLTIANLYELGRRLAIYWKDNSRRYKVTKREKESGDLYCPRCAKDKDGNRSVLKPRTYRQNKRVYSCAKCGFHISPKDLIAKNLLKIAADLGKTDSLLGYELEHSVLNLIKNQ